MYQPPSSGTFTIFTVPVPALRGALFLCKISGLPIISLSFAVMPPKGRWVYLLVTFTLNTAEVFVLDAIKPATILLASISLFCSCNKAVRAAKTFL